MLTIQVNSVFSGARTETTNFTAYYISPYLVVRNGGEYTKHIYMGGQRITSKVSNSGIFTTSPVTTTDLQAKYTAQTAKIKERYDSLGVTYKGMPQTGGLVSSNPVATANSYFYHSDHLGSSSLITDQSGDIVQHLEYVPFGETFIDERRSASSWITPYLFSGKERDEETGLLYFGARYQDSKYGIWYSVDPLMNDYLNVDEYDNIFNSKTLNSYAYANQNPVKFSDYEGGLPIPVITGAIGAVINTGINVYDQVNKGSFDIGSGKTWARMGVAAGSGFIAGATGNIEVAVASNAAGNLADQLISNDGNLSKVNITSVVVSGALGGASTKMAKALANAPIIEGISLNLADRLSPYIAKSASYVLGKSSFYIKTGTTPLNYITTRAANIFGSTTSNTATGVMGLNSMPDYLRNGYCRFFKSKSGRLTKATVSVGTPQVVQFGDRKVGK